MMLRAVDDPDAVLPGSAEVSSSSVTASITSDATLTCPEALPILFALFQQSGASLHRIVHGLSSPPHGPWYFMPCVQV